MRDREAERERKEVEEIYLERESDGARVYVRGRDYNYLHSLHYLSLCSPFKIASSTV